MTASGCGAHVRDYGELLRDDPLYRDKAQRFSELTKDIAEVVETERKQGRLPQLPPRPLSTRPKLIATANIGCLTHLAAASPLPVRHWIELLDETLAETAAGQ